MSDPLPGSGRALVTGGGGALASDLEELLTGRCELHVRSQAELDVTDPVGVARVFEELRPEVVFNTAAFHNVDVCEREEDPAFAVNATAVKRLAEQCARQGARLVHFSTNYVFDGTRDEPYGEEDTPAPQSAYAVSKLAGERMALAYAPDALVIRTAGLYGLHGSQDKGGNFVQRVIARARERGAVSMVADQRLTPTFTADLARAVEDAVEAGAAGLVHLTNAGVCSWLDFTAAIFELAGLDVPIEPVPTVRRDGMAARPLNGVLARPRADALGLKPLRPWLDALEDYMTRAKLRA